MKHNRNKSSRRMVLEQLEERTMLAVSIASLPDITVPETKTFNLPVDVQLSGADVGKAVTVTASSNNQNVTVSVTPSTNEYIRISTTINGLTQNDILIQLFNDLAPETVDSITDRVDADFFDGRVFHRIIPDFVAQFGNDQFGGFPTDLTPIIDEYNALATFIGFGQLAMAKTDVDDSGTAQVFITDSDLSVGGIEPPQHLNLNHTIFGQVIEGFDVLTDIIAEGTGSGTPLGTVIITNMEVVADSENAVVRVSVREGFTGDASVTVRASTDTSASQQSINVDGILDATNDRAFLMPVGDMTTLEDTPLEFTLDGVDIDSADILTYTIRDADDFSSQPADVEVQIDQATGAVTLTPREDFNGQIRLRIGVRDSIDRSLSGLENILNYDTEEIVLTVTAVNDAPDALSQNLRIAQGTTTIQIQLGADDGDDDVEQAITFEVLVQPEHGSLNGPDTEGLLTYLPGPTFTGSDRFFFRVRDDGGTANGGKNVSSRAPITILTADAPGRADLLSGGILRIMGDEGNNNIRIATTSGASDLIDVIVDDLFIGAFSRDNINAFRMMGLDGNDRIALPSGETTPAIMLGGAGRDTLVGGRGADDLRAEAGNDKLLGGVGDDTLRGGEGRDKIFGGQGSDDLRGDVGRDTIRGQAGDDRIRGHAGADLINGNGGRDLIFGGDGNDNLNGGRGNDEVEGDDGDDTIKGAGENDILRGGGGNDVISGQGGMDALFGGDGDNTMNGGAGSDYLMSEGARSRDLLVGAAGDDVMGREGGDDTMNGGAGADLFGSIDLRGRTDFDHHEDFFSHGAIVLTGDDHDDEHDDGDDDHNPIGIGDFRDPELMGTRTDLLPNAPDVESRDHVQPGATDYDGLGFSNPPTYGPHVGIVNAGTVTPRPTGFYENPQDDDRLIHNLEHGHVWISYDPSNVEAVDIAVLEVLGRTFGLSTGVVVTSRPANDDDQPIAVASWAHLEKMDHVDIDFIKEFIQHNRGHSPEGFIP